jgi:predicted transcriptional regulator
MAKNARGKVTISAEIEEGIRDRLDSRATEENRSRSETVGRAILFYLEYAEVEKVVVAVPKPKAKGKGK